MEFFLGLLIGLFIYPGYKLHRALKSSGWDTSNVNNFLRTEAHLAIHPEDFGQMWYLSEDVIHFLRTQAPYAEDIDFNRPFEYISGDEFSDHFPNSRP